MNYIFTISLVILSFWNVSSQNPTFNVTELPPMPEPVANNAVVSAMSGDTVCVYSFCGIDSTKTPQGIHLKAWKYNTITEVWSQLPDVPDDTGNGKIAAGASVVNNKIYLIGGYYVEDNFSELSSDDVHVFNPETNQWEADAALIPVPIDDHVQAVWQESLIYIVTGWSNTNNVPDVQIYNPSENVWLEGTSTPNNSDYKVFGGSGDILGNKIIYHGGVRSGFGFFPTAEVRVGQINPLSPNLIDWEIMGDSDQGTTYRAAAIAIPESNSVFWIGGSALGYNFDGIDYNNTGGVEPLDRIIAYNGFTSAVTTEANVVHETANTLPMDLRGIARISTLESEEQNGIHRSIICGGMAPNQEVSDKTFLLTSDNITSVSELNPSDLALQWQITANILSVLSPNQKLSSIELFSMDGKKRLVKEGRSSRLEADIATLERGIYILHVHGGTELETTVKISIQ